MINTKKLRNLLAMHESSVKVRENDEGQPFGWCAERSGKYAIVCRACELEAAGLPELLADYERLLRERGGEAKVAASEVKKLCESVQEFLNKEGEEGHTVRR